jgi:hypothetical protein
MSFEPALAWLMAKTVINQHKIELEISTSGSRLALPVVCRQPLKQKSTIRTNDLFDAAYLTFYICL